MKKEYQKEFGKMIVNVYQMNRSGLSSPGVVVLPTLPLCSEKNCWKNLSITKRKHIPRTGISGCDWQIMERSWKRFPNGCCYTGCMINLLQVFPTGGLD